MSETAFVDRRLLGWLRGSSLTSRVMRSSALTMAGFGFSQGIRLASNLILTRILFPEAFGLMALVMVFMVGLQMFSDFGVGPAISRSPRGDEPAFLDTVWTLQILRGVVLFVFGCLLAAPIASFYGEPVLFGMLIVASVQFLVLGLMPTRRETANRHLALGRLTLLDMLSQLISVLIIVALAFLLQSVWGLVIGMLIGTCVQVLTLTLFLPGHRNRLNWDRPTVSEVLHFGKWIFLSTICGFLLAQSDKMILGKFLPLDVFGVYNIGFFLGSFPLMLGLMVISRILIPVYRDCPPLASRENFLKLRRMRIIATAALLSMLGAVGFAGVWLVDLLYDDRYIQAGAIVVLIACIQIPLVIGLTYDQAALAAGDSRRFFVVSAIKALLMVSGLLIGVQTGGLIGALIGQGLGVVAAYPALVWLSARLGVWDLAHDLGFALIGLGIAGAAIWWNWEAIAGLAV
jgi:O-antigen/teichoic acid export membrane protein